MEPSSTPELKPKKGMYQCTLAWDEKNWPRLTQPNTSFKVVMAEPTLTARYGKSDQVVVHSPKWWSCASLLISTQSSLRHFKDPINWTNLNHPTQFLRSWINVALVNNTTLINFGGMGASSRFSETSILSHPWRHIADVTAASCTCAWAVTVPSAVSKVLDQRDSGLQGGPSAPPKF